MILIQRKIVGIFVEEINVKQMWKERGLMIQMMRRHLLHVSFLFVVVDVVVAAAADVAVVVDSATVVFDEVAVAAVAVVDSAAVDFATLDVEAGDLVV